MENFIYWLSGDFNRDLYGAFFVYVAIPVGVIALIIYIAQNLSQHRDTVLLWLKLIVSFIGGWVAVSIASLATRVFPSPPLWIIFSICGVLYLIFSLDHVQRKTPRRAATYGAIACLCLLLFTAIVALTY